jgi:hypothetical protein
MSAYVVEKSVIDFALSAYVELCRDRGVLYLYLDPKDGKARYIEIPYGDQKALSEIGGQILAENCKSVGYRYNEPPVAGEADYVFKQHRGVYVNDKRKLIGMALSAISCIEYQSCEHPDWFESDARQILNSMSRAIAYQLPEARGDGWGQFPHLPDGVGPISIFDMARKGKAA